MWVNYRNGKLHWLRKRAKREFDGSEFRINQQVFDIFQKPVGRIEKFITEYDYVRAIIKGEKVDIDELYID